MNERIQRIGIVETDDSWIKIVDEELKVSGYLTKTFKKAEDVLAAYEDLDGISTAGGYARDLDGLQLAIDLRDKGYKGPIIMVSGALPTKERMESAGITDSVDKSNKEYNEVAGKFSASFYDKARNTLAENSLRIAEQQLNLYEIHGQDVEGSPNYLKTAEEQLSLASQRLDISEQKSRLDTFKNDQPMEE